MTTQEALRVLEIPQTSLARALGITDATVSRKIHGINGWKPGEIYRLYEVLHKVDASIDVAFVLDLINTTNELRGAA
ncbi:MAG: hypothetical protein K8R59_00550 [Thermoanaerobaculales bacterium]|nr:hypothetical protein [Thermoanaerobaculales bacterium]